MVHDELVQQTSRNMYNLYEPTTYETIRTPFVGVNNDFQMGINETIATKNSYLTELARQIQEKQETLKEWKEKREPEPTNQQDETKEARKTLKKAGDSFIPLHEADEFQKQVPDGVQ